MAIYEVAPNKFRKIEETSFSDVDLKERQDLQRLLRGQIDVVCPDTLVIAEEFSQWEESSRRIDLLAIDKQANLVVIELKRGETGGHMELQSIRYAAMISTMTFERATEVFQNYLSKRDKSLNASTEILEFLEWEQPDEDRFAQDIRIVLVSAEFSKELTTSVIWLNERGLNIECVRIKPYNDHGRILADVQQIIPLPEAEDYRVGLKEKQQKERSSKTFNPDLTKYDVTVNGVRHERLNKRQAIFTIIKQLIAAGHTPEKISSVVPGRQDSLFRMSEGKLTSEEFVDRNLLEAEQGGRSLERRRFYCDQDQLFIVGDNTYAVSNQWGAKTQETIDALLASFPNSGVTCEASPSSW